MGNCRVFFLDISRHKLSEISPLENFFRRSLDVQVFELQQRKTSVKKNRDTSPSSALDAVGPIFSARAVLADSRTENQMSGTARPDSRA